jgi:hypothetical protein
VSGFEDDWTSCSSLLDLEPASGTDAPAIAGLEAGETELRHGGAEIVAESLRGLEEGCVDETTDGVDAEVIGASLAAAGAVEPGHRLATTDIERLAEDVFATVFDGFYGGHQIPFFQYPTCRQGTATSPAKIFLSFSKDALPLQVQAGVDSVVEGEEAGRVFSMV